MSVKTIAIFVCFGFVQFSYCQPIGFGNNNIGPGCNNSPNNLAFGNGLPNNYNGVPNFSNNFGSGNLAARNIGSFSSGNLASNLGSFNSLNTNGVGSGMTNSGYGDISIVGEMPVGGTTAVAGNVPVIGYVTFEGHLPAGGLVSVVNNCNC